MSTRTVYYNLTKPEGSEHVDVDVLNANADIIDTQMHANSEAAREASKNAADAYDETATYTAGALCIYQNILYKANATTTGAFDPTAWDPTTISAEFEPKHTWTLLETYTVDTASRTVRRDLPAGTNGVFVRVTLAAAAANAEFGIVVKTTERHGLGDIANYIQTSTGYGLAQYTRDGGLWRGFLTQRVSSLQASGTHTERMDGFALDDADAEYIEFRTNTSGAVVPEGSQFVIYTRS